MKILIPINAFKAAIHCVANKYDVRYYLQGVHVEVFGAQANVVATDGSCMLACKVAVENSESSFNLIIPTDTAKAAVKSTIANKWWDKRWLELTELTGGHYSLADQIFKPIDGKFPDWKRVIPKAVSGEAGSYNPEIVMRVSKAVCAFYDCKHARLIQGGPASGMGGNPAVVCGTDDTCIGIIMPWRDNGGSEYLGFSPATAEETAEEPQEALAA